MMVNISKQSPFELLILDVKKTNTGLYYNRILKCVYSQVSLNTYEAAWY
jgi:hypothetical protein